MKIHTRVPSKIVHQIEISILLHSSSLSLVYFMAARLRVRFRVSRYQTRGFHQTQLYPFFFLFTNGSHEIWRKQNFWNKFLNPRKFNFKIGCFIPFSFSTKEIFILTKSLNSSTSFIFWISSTPFICSKPRWFVHFNTPSSGIKQNQLLEWNSLCAMFWVNFLVFAWRI